jgi:hypothetical protein
MKKSAEQLKRLAAQRRARIKLPRTEAEMEAQAREFAHKHRKLLKELVD